MRVFRSMFVVFLLHASTCGRYTVDLIPVNERKRNTLNLKKKKKKEKPSFYRRSSAIAIHPAVQNVVHETKEKGLGATHTKSKRTSQTIVMFLMSTFSTSP